MQNFKDTFETCKQSFIIGLSVCITAPLRMILDTAVETIGLRKLNKANFLEANNNLMEISKV